MSIDALRYVFREERTTSGHERLVLLVLADYANAEGESYPGVARIAERANMTERAVQACLTRLAEAGVIERTINAAPDSRIRADRRPNLYRINGVCSGGTPLGSEAAFTGCAPTAERGVLPQQNGVCSEHTQVVIDPPVEPPDPNPPCPPASGGMGLAVRGAFESEATPALRALSGGMEEPGPQFLLAMAAGGWSAPDEVPDMPAAVEAWWDSLEVKPFVPKKDAQKLGREAARNGMSPAQFLVTLCTANVVTPRAMDLARNRLARADLPGMSGMRGGKQAVGKRSAMAAQGKAMHEQRQAKERRRRAASKVIDAESEEIT